MKRLGQASIIGLASALALSASGCIAEHEYLRDDGPPAGPSALPPVGSAGDDDSAIADAPRAQITPGADVSDDYFDDKLAPYGQWETTPEYGRVWVPNDVSADFRPYYDGNWAYTDYGWTYASPAPWAWACYHYGRWGYGVGLGWYWLPGRVWGPAWVNWRWGGGYVAWSPLGPRGAYWGAGSRAWTVVGERHFTQPIRAVAVSGASTPGIIARTTPQAFARPTAGGTFGPPVGRISAAVGHQIQPVAVNRVVTSGVPGRVTNPSAGVGQRGYSSRGGGDRWNRPSSSGRSYGSGRYGNSYRYGGARGGSRYGYGGGRSSGGTRSGGSRSSGAGHSSAGHSGGGSHGGGGHR